MKSGLSVQCLHQFRDTVKRTVQFLALFRILHRRIRRLIRLIQTHLKGQTAAAQCLTIKDPRCRTEIKSKRLKEFRRLCPEFRINMQRQRLCMRHCTPRLCFN